MLRCMTCVPYHKTTKIPLDKRGGVPWLATRRTVAWEVLENLDVTEVSFSPCEPANGKSNARMAERFLPLEAGAGKSNRSHAQLCDRQAQVVSSMGAQQSRKAGAIH